MKKTVKKSSKTCMPKDGCCGGKGMIYFLAMIGAAIYYVSTSTSFWNGVLGILKAIIWPLFLMIEVLKFLGA